jgi:hypothetical protein
MLSIRTKIRQLLECLVSWILPKEDLVDDKSSLTNQNLNGCVRVAITNFISNYTSLFGCSDRVNNCRSFERIRFFHSLVQTVQVECTMLFRNVSHCEPKWHGLTSHRTWIISNIALRISNNASNIPVNVKDFQVSHRIQLLYFGLNVFKTKSHAHYVFL